MNPCNATVSKQYSWWGIFGMLLVAIVSLPYSTLANSEDFFDRYPSLGKSVGVEKLTQQERSNLSSLIEGVVDISSSGSNKSCEGKIKDACESAMRSCRSACMDSTVWDYETGTPRRNTNLGDICSNSCRTVMNSCRP